MAQPRNKISKLPLELRLEVAEMLMAGCHTQDAIRDMLRARGVAEDDIPHNTAFLAYRESTEYTGLVKEQLSWRNKARKQQALAEASKLGGGIEGAVNIALYASLEKLSDALQSGNYDEENVCKIANAIKGIKGVSISDRNLELAEQLRAAQTKIAELEAELARMKAPAEEKKADPVAVANELNKLLGVVKK